MTKFQTPPTQTGFMKRAILRSVKIPLIYLLLGLIFTSVGFANNFFDIPVKWQSAFDITDKIANFFIILAILSFVFRYTTTVTRHYERSIHDQHPIGTLVLISFRQSLRIIYLLLVLNIIITIAGPSKVYLSFAKNVLDMFIIASIGWMAAHLLHMIEAVLYQRMQYLKRDEHNRIKGMYTKLHILRNILTVVIAVITIAVMLMTFDSVKNIGISLLASAGFITAIIGLSAQKTLSSLFAGLQIALSQTIKLGDSVVIDGANGVIEEITFTYVVLKMGDKRRLIIPINFFIEKPFENWSREASGMGSSFHIFVDYAVPIEPLRQELERILKEANSWDGYTNKLQVADLTDRAVDIKIQISAIDAEALSELRAEVTEKMLIFIRENYPNAFPKLHFNNAHEEQHKKSIK